MVFGLMTKLLRGVKNFETGLNIFATPNIVQLKNYIELVSKLNTRVPILLYTLKPTCQKNCVIRAEFQNKCEGEKENPAPCLHNQKHNDAR